MTGLFTMVFGTALVSALGLLLLAVLAAPLVALWRWRGDWRLGAAVALAAWAVKIALVVRDVAADPTSHNLWPLELAMFALGPGLWLLILWIARAVTGAGRGAAPSPGAAAGRGPSELGPYVESSDPKQIR